MRVLHVMAGADAGGAETMMLDGVLALADAGVEQRVVTRGAPDRIAAIRAAGVPVDEAAFDKIWRFPTQAKINSAIKALDPDVIHYWMGRAGMFAPAAHREKSLGWYGGYYKLSRFKNCAWQAGVTKDIARHIVEQGAPADRVSTLHTFAAIEDAAPVSRADFDTRIKAYVALHRKLANETGEIDETKNPRQITDREVALGKLIRAARAQERRGDIFTPPIEAFFKQLISEESARRSPRVRTDRKEDQDELADFTPTVNQAYPPTQPLVTFPAGLLRVLPKLPRELEYRLVQRNLILRDIAANVIIDFIPAATP